MISYILFNYPLFQAIKAANVLELLCTSCESCISFSKNLPRVRNDNPEKEMYVLGRRCKSILFSFLVILEKSCTVVLYNSYWNNFLTFRCCISVSQQINCNTSCTKKNTCLMQHTRQKSLPNFPSVLKK